MTEEPPLSLPLAAGATALVERLQAREQKLAAEREQRQAVQQAEADGREDVKAFITTFSAEFSSLQDQGSALQQEAGSSSTLQQDAAAKAALLQQLDGLSLGVVRLEQATSDACYFLPPYELRSCTSQLQQLRAQLANTKQQLQPKRKFAFSRAVARTAVGGTAPTPNTVPTPAAQQQPAAPHAGPPAAAAAAAGQPLAAAAAAHGAAAAAAAGAAAASAAETAAPPPLSVQDQQLVASGRGFAGLRGQLLVARAEQLAGGGFVLHDLTDCQVFLLGAMSALRLQHLTRCHVATGPVSGAAFVDACSGCTLMLASYQVRIHRAQACDFYLRCRSRPIIEHSSGLRFAPYEPAALLREQQQQQLPPQAVQPLQHPQPLQPRPQTQAVGGADADPLLHEPASQGPAADAVSPGGQLQRLLAAAQLGEGNELWRQVDDFGWVKASASPHWCVLPEEERQQPPAVLPPPPPQQQQHGRTS